MADNGVTYRSAQATIWRWREAYQHDFAARMDWCVADACDQANHNPVAVLAGDRSKAVARMTVKPGQAVSLDASGTHDPDGNNLTYRWFVYDEAGTCRERATIEKYATPMAHLTVPQVTSPATIHVILEVKDDGTPNLCAYRRLILEIQP